MTLHLCHSVYIDTEKKLIITIPVSANISIGNDVKVKLQLTEMSKINKVNIK